VSPNWSNNLGFAAPERATSSSGISSALVGFASTVLAISCSCPREVMFGGAVAPPVPSLRTLRPYVPIESMRQRQEQDRRRVPESMGRELPHVAVDVHYARADVSDRGILDPIR
jgi:hypothetical protein